MDIHDIVGRWSIVAWRQDYDDGRTTHPMGEDLGGFVDYGVDGALAVLIARRGRAPFTTGGQWSASDEEKARAYDGLLSYCGRYVMAGDEIQHHVEFSLFPNWEGSLQKRRAALVDSRLHLTARIEEGTTEARTASLIWTRAQE
jgi:hypothetical protein